MEDLTNSPQLGAKFRIGLVWLGTGLILGLSDSKARMSSHILTQAKLDEFSWEGDNQGRAQEFFGATLCRGKKKKTYSQQWQDINIKKEKFYENIILLGIFSRFIGVYVTPAVIINSNWWTCQFWIRQLSLTSCILTHYLIGITWSNDFGMNWPDGLDFNWFCH